MTRQESRPEVPPYCWATIKRRRYGAPLYRAGWLNRYFIQLVAADAQLAGCGGQIELTVSTVPGIAALMAEPLAILRERGIAVSVKLRRWR